MITKQQLRQENALEDWFSSNAISSKVAAAKAKQRLRDYRPDPTTGKQKPGVLVRFGLVSIDNLMSMLRGCYYLVAARARTGKCLGKGTPILMYDGSIKAVEDVRIGDLLMGDDSTPRTVLGLAGGRAQMYWVRQNKAMDYRVNGEHILCLKRSWTEWSQEKGDILEIATEAAYRRKRNLEKRYKGYRVAVDFPERDLALEPYFLGLWLGDGNSINVKIYTGDTEVADYLEEYAERLGMSVSVGDKQDNCSSYSIVSGSPGGKQRDSIQGRLRAAGLLGNKHIPQEYLASSRQQRLELLAGLVDSDGHYAERTNYIEITMNKESLIRQIALLANTLGFRGTVAPRMTQAQTGPAMQVWRLTISGNLEEVPTKIARKQARPSETRVDQTVTGISIEPDCVDDYYGFVVDGNSRFLLGDCTVTHNSAFAMQVSENAMKQLEGTGKKIAIFSAEMDAASLVGREACAAERVSYWHMVKGLLTPDQYDAVERRMDDIGESAFWLDETSSPTIEHMIEQLDALQQDKGGIGLVIFDYLELAGDYEREEVKRIAKISRGLKAIAKKFECPVLALGQLNRDIDRRTDKKPSLADLMYGGEREPDGIMVLHRPSLYDDTIKKQKIGDKEVELTECHVIKHRHGPGGIAHIAFEESTMRFFSAEVQRTNLEARE